MTLEPYDGLAIALVTLAGAMASIVWAYRVWRATMR